MINIKEIFSDEEIAASVALWLPDDCDGAELAGAAEYAAETNVPALSVVPRDVGVVWPWVEKLDVKLLPRFYVGTVNVDTMSELAINVKSVLKQGADGAQVIVPLAQLEKFADSVAPVRDDLFFTKYFSVGLDIFEIWPLDWPRVFAALNKLRATSVLLILSHDDMDKSDFTGRIYAALNAWDAAPDTELCVVLRDSFFRAPQVYRLVEKNRPELLDKLRFFVDY